jgi:serine/threonine protein kinase
MRTLTFNRIIGTGSFGTVYHAELRVPRGFSRQCAVKVMKSTSPDQEHFRARMRDEARLLGMLQDEQILGVSELVRVDGRDIVVMEYVEGVDLSDIIDNHRVPPRALAELGAEMAGTLDRAHSARHPNTGEPLSVVHRDVKPANVMVTRRGGVRLLDFGVARAAFASRESETQGLVLGTLNYFPPEILAGADPSPSVDIYGLGLILWECATGKEWGSPQVHRKRFDRRVKQRLAAIGDEYRDLLPVLEAILNWDPAERPKGADVEAQLLTAADACTGEGLRTWARTVVPPILQARAKNPPQDELVGRTLPIEGEDSVAPLQPLPQDLPDIPERPADSMTYNDLAPPAAVDRRSRKRKSADGSDQAPEEDVYERPTELAIPRDFGKVDQVASPPAPRSEAKSGFGPEEDTEAVTERVGKKKPRPQPTPIPPRDKPVSKPVSKRRSGGVPSVWLVVAAAVILGLVIGAILVVMVALALFAIRLGM